MYRIFIISVWWSRGYCCVLQKVTIGECDHYPNTNKPIAVQDTDCAASANHYCGIEYKTKKNIFKLLHS